MEGLTDDQRSNALARFQVIRPFLHNRVPLARIARENKLDLSTLKRWVRLYRLYGLGALTRKTRTDKNTFRIPAELQQVIEGLALQRPAPSIATIQRETAKISKKLGHRAPSYDIVYRIVNGLDPALLTLARDGSQTYSKTYDLVHRTEASSPNAIWQADHTELDILVKDAGKSRKPWCLQAWRTGKGPDPPVI